MMEASFTPACKIFLRKGQNPQDLDSHPDPEVRVYSPLWVGEGLNILSGHLNGRKFHVFGTPPATPGRWNKKPKLDEVGESRPLKTFIFGEKISAEDLQTLARNESWNTSGVIDLSLYESGGLKDTNVILAMKDLARHSVIVGKTLATHYGGYPDKANRVPLKPAREVYIIHLVGLQFLKPENTGRLVVIEESSSKSSSTAGLLDEFIFQKVVGEKKRTYEEALMSTEVGRYHKAKGFNAKSPKTLFDSFAYRKFIAGDVVLTALALAESTEDKKVCFKFLKYGAGKFAGRFGEEISRFILPGVVDGMGAVYGNRRMRGKVEKVIGHWEFPFYDKDKESVDRLERLREKFGTSYGFSKDDALKPIKGLVTATTNCGASFSVIGNAMGFGSVDGAIASNLKDTGATFCPLLNPVMSDCFVDTEN